MAKAKLKFEEALIRLEKIVAQLEDPDVTLDQTLALFEEGKRLSEQCQSQLADVEGKVLKLVERLDGSMALEEFEGEQ